MIELTTIDCLNPTCFHSISDSYNQNDNAKKQNYILSGKVTDESTGQVLQGASIYFPEFKKGVISAANGSYEIALPQGEHIVEVSFIGFSIYTKTVFVKSNQQENFKLGHSAVENSNITVTSFLRATSSRKTPTPINIIKQKTKCTCTF